MNFGRLVTAMVTPFDNTLQVDYQSLQKLIDYLIVTQKADSIVVCGTTGESPTLSEQEKIELFERTVEIVNGRCKVIAGTGSYDTAHAIHLTRIAEKAGVDGVLLVAPYYNRPSQEGIYQHFHQISDRTLLPIMLYNIPSRTGINIDAETTIRLSKQTNVVATKESSGNLDQVADILSNVNDSFLVYSGDDNLTLPILAIGGYGVVSVASHVIGREIQEMITCFHSGDVTLAAEWHRRLMPVFNGLFQCPHRVPNPVPVKYALHLKGISVGGVRLPLVGLTNEEKQFVEQLFVKSYREV